MLILNSTKSKQCFENSSANFKSFCEDLLCGSCMDSSRSYCPELIYGKTIKNINKQWSSSHHKHTQTHSHVHTYTDTHTEPNTPLLPSEMCENGGLESKEDYRYKIVIISELGVSVQMAMPPKHTASWELLYKYKGEKVRSFCRLEQSKVTQVRSNQSRGRSETNTAGWSRAEPFRSSPEVSQSEQAGREPIRAWQSLINHISDQSMALLLFSTLTT